MDSVDGIDVSNEGDRVVVRIEHGRWEGSASEAERLLTRLHYVLDRARPGTNIASLFLNGQLWGSKTIESDRRAAISAMHAAIDQLAEYVRTLDETAAEETSE